MIPKSIYMLRYKPTWIKFSKGCRHCERKFREGQRIISKKASGSTKYYCIPCSIRVCIINEEDECYLRKKLDQSIKKRKEMGFVTGEIQ